MRSATPANHAAYAAHAARAAAHTAPSVAHSTCCCCTNNTWTCSTSVSPVNRLDDAVARGRRAPSARAGGRRAASFLCLITPVCSYLYGDLYGGLYERAHNYNKVLSPSARAGGRRAPWCSRAPARGRVCHLVIILIQTCLMTAAIVCIF